MSDILFFDYVKIRCPIYDRWNTYGPSFSWRDFGIPDHHIESMREDMFWDQLPCHTRHLHTKEQLDKWEKRFGKITTLWATEPLCHNSKFIASCVEFELTTKGNQKNVNPIRKNARINPF